MKLVEGKFYRFKPLRELRKVSTFNSYGHMDYLAETIVQACGVGKDNCFNIPGIEGGRLWIIYPEMLEEICEEPVEDKVFSCIVVHPSVKDSGKTTLTKHLTEEEALEKISECIESGLKGTYRMYQLYQEVEPPKLDISGMIRKIVDKILPKAE